MSVTKTLNEIINIVHNIEPKDYSKQIILLLSEVINDVNICWLILEYKFMIEKIDSPNTIYKCAAANCSKLFKKIKEIELITLSRTLYFCSIECKEHYKNDQKCAECEIGQHQSSLEIFEGKSYCTKYDPYGYYIFVCSCIKFAK